jgi:hypothetical protein
MNSKQNFFPGVNMNKTFEDRESRDVMNMSDVMNMPKYNPKFIVESESKVSLRN